MTLTEQKLALINYLKMKTEQSDWHGVSDAANDLRELEAQIKHQPKQQHNSVNTPVVRKPRKPMADTGLPTTGFRGPTYATSPSEVTPTQLEIPHNVGKVASLLKMGDEELLDNLFPLPKGVEA